MMLQSSSVPGEPTNQVGRLQPCNKLLVLLWQDVVGGFLPAKLGATWKVLYGNSWSLASGQSPGLGLGGTRWGVGLFSHF